MYNFAFFSLAFRWVLYVIGFSIYTPSSKCGNVCACIKACIACISLDSRAACTTKCNAQNTSPRSPSIHPSSEIYIISAHRHHVIYICTAVRLPNIYFSYTFISLYFIYTQRVLATGYDVRGFHIVETYFGVRPS